MAPPPIRLSPADIRGVLGMIPTPSTPDADRWDCENSVELDETARMVSRVLAGGVEILLSNGSLGEGATLTAREHQDFTDCVVQTLNGRGLLFAGVTTLNTRDTIERARSLIALGADGLFLGRPMWMSLDPPGIVRFYRDLAEALPGVPFIVYDNQYAFKAKITTETYAELSTIPAIVAAKHIGGPAIGDDLRAVESRMRILPLDTQWCALARDFPEDALACWSGNAADGTEPLIALQKAVADRDWTRAEEISARMSWAQAPMFPGGRIEVFVDYNIPLAHARSEGAGLVIRGRPGRPTSPPRRNTWLADARQGGAGRACARSFRAEVWTCRAALHVGRPARAR